MFGEGEELSYIGVPLSPSGDREYISNMITRECPLLHVGSCEEPVRLLILSELRVLTTKPPTLKLTPLLSFTHFT